MLQFIALIIAVLAVFALVRRTKGCGCCSGLLFFLMAIWIISVAVRG